MADPSLGSNIKVSKPDTVVFPFRVVKASAEDDKELNETGSRYAKKNVPKRY